MTRRKGAEPSCASAEPSAAGVGGQGDELGRGGLLAAGSRTARKDAPASPVNNLQSLAATDPGRRRPRRLGGNRSSLLSGSRGPGVVGTEPDVSGGGRSLAPSCATSGTRELLLPWIARHVIQDASRPEGVAGGAGAWPRLGPLLG